MKNKKIATIIIIIVVLLFIWGRSYLMEINRNTNHYTIFRYVGLFLLFLTVLSAVCITWLLYRKEWINVLGLKSKNITKKNIGKAFGIGVLWNVLSSIILLTVYVLVFQEMPKPNFGKISILNLLLSSLIIAPFTEELLFRGFIQGLLQKLYTDKEKLPICTIIVTTSVLFAITHFGLLFHIAVKQFILTGLSILILSLYLGWLRYKYQSIIPSIFAHFGFNIGFIVTIPLLVIFFMTVKENNSFSNIKYRIEKSEYIQDTTGYNFDPNNRDEWQKSFKKFTVLKREWSPELIKCLRGTTTSIPIYFTIDTCGNINNVFADAHIDSILYTEFKYNFGKYAIKLVQSLPQCKPFIVDGKKVEKEMCEYVEFY